MNAEYMQAMMEALTPKERREYRALDHLQLWQMTEEAQERLERLHERIVDAL